ncbi:hypothetical protein ACQKFE_15115, partial [Stutzerimonas stutzeri]|uniref:hypothetical protein n=1 Tax=Stutzerimonas stutzeri TaxID=316 RepID=UPI003D001F2C
VKTGLRSKLRAARSKQPVLTLAGKLRTGLKPAWLLGSAVLSLAKKQVCVLSLAPPVLNNPF